jgi:hypothetical protein
MTSESTTRQGNLVMPDATLAGHYSDIDIVAVSLSQLEPKNLGVLSAKSADLEEQCSGVSESLCHELELPIHVVVSLAVLRRGWLFNAGEPC